MKINQKNLDTKPKGETSIVTALRFGINKDGFVTLYGVEHSYILSYVADELGRPMEWIIEQDLNLEKNIRGRV